MRRRIDEGSLASGFRYTVDPGRRGLLAGALPRCWRSPETRRRSLYDNCLLNPGYGAALPERLAGHEIRPCGVEARPWRIREDVNKR